MINSYNDVTRVSFFQKDITNSEVYGENYDVILAFSVYTYIKAVLGNIASICDGVFILETHQLKGNLESEYFANLDPFFEHRRIIAETDWGTNKSDSEKRVVIALSNNLGLLDNIIKL